MYGQWVFAAGFDGFVHKYALATGRESTTGGWPERFTRMPFNEKASAALVVSGHYLYVTTSGFRLDAVHWEGHLVAIDLATGHANVWNGLCNHVKTLLSGSTKSRDYCPYWGAGMFGRGQAAIDPVNKDVYVVTGDGPWNGATNWGDSILRLSLDGSRLVGFTPTNQAYLWHTDSDLGSSGAAILPLVSVQGKTYHLLLQGGKASAVSEQAPTALYLVNRDLMNGSKPGAAHLGGQLQIISSPGGCPLFTAPAVWTAPTGQIYVFYADDCAVGAYVLQNVRAGNAADGPGLVSRGLWGPLHHAGDVRGCPLHRTGRSRRRVRSGHGAKDLVLDLGRRWGAHRQASLGVSGRLRRYALRDRPEGEAVRVCTAIAKRAVRPNSSHCHHARFVCCF